MAINIQGDNNGIVVEGDLTIEHLDFTFGKGVASATEKRTGESRQDAFCVQDAECVEEIPMVEERRNAYPEVTKVQMSFFNETLWVSGTVYGQPSKVLDIPVGQIMHLIYDQTTEWNPADSTSVHKWKIMYETLRRLKYFRIEQKPRYAAFVKAVVGYCFPEVADNYSNNLSKSRLDEHIEMWTKEDKALHRTLKEALTFAR